MAVTLLQLMVMIAALLVSQAVLAIFMCCGFFGSASFGRWTSSRILAKIGAGILLSLLLLEWVVFQVICKPQFDRWCMLFNVLLALVLWCYLKTAFADPGTRDSPEWEAWKSQLVLTGQEDVIVSSGEVPKKKKGWAPGEVSYCTECESRRPERSHHCKHCGTCVLRMDHHCPLIGNCVGWRNHKNYLLLQWYQFWCCMCFLFCPGGPGERAVCGNVSFESAVLDLIVDCAVAWAAMLVLVTGKTFAVGCIMAFKNETHIEGLYGGWNPYSLPTPVANLRQLFGELDWKMFLPLAARSEDQGTSFPVAPSWLESKGKTVAYGKDYGSV